MTFTDFMEKWNGKYIDFDGYYGSQCMDSMHQYIVEVLGLTDGRILAAPSAKDVYNNYDTIYGKEYFEKIANTLTGVPQEGDIVLWGSGTYGHVAIFVDGDASRFRSFDQNYPTGTPCHIQEHSYANCLGWLRFKNTPMVSVESAVFENLVRKSTLYDWILQTLKITDNETIVKANIETFMGYEDVIRHKDEELEASKTQLSSVQEEAKDLVNRLEEMKLVMKEDKETIGYLDEKYANMGIEFEIIKKQLEVLQAEKPVDKLTALELILMGIRKLVKGVSI